MTNLKEYIKKACPSLVSLKQTLYKHRLKYIKNIFFPLPFPNIIPVQTSNRCNARCIFCQYQSNIDKKASMDFEIFRHIVFEALKYNISTIHFIGAAGEIYLDKGIIDKITFAKKHGLRVYITTNGTLFHINDYARRTLQLNIERIFISTPGFSEDAYQRLFGIKNYKKFFPGIIELLQYKEKYKLKTSICFGFRLDRSVAEAEQDTDYITHIKPFVDRGILTPEDHRTKFDDWAGEVPKNRFIRSMKVLTHTSNKFCPKLYTPQISILYDGSVKLCGCSYHKTEFDDMIIGNIKSGLKECLGSPTVKRIFFNYILKKKLPSICQTCTRPDERKA